MLLSCSAAIFIAGCGEAFNDTPGELEAKTTLSDIKRIRANPDVHNPLPSLYLQPPQTVKVSDGIKLFYFTRQQPAVQMAKLITSQLGYKVTANDATNQLVIHCADDIEVGKAIEFMQKVDLAPIQVNIDCMIVELYADKTMDRETTIAIEDLFGANITLDGKSPTFPGASLRETKRATFGLGAGYSSSKVEVLVDMLVSRGYLKILMNPTIETVNGRKAKIISKDDVPIQKIVTQQNVLPYSITEYQWVEDSLEVTPYVFADGSIGLTTEVKIGSSTKPKGVVQSSVITERSIKIEENRIQPGYSLVVGGIRKTEKRDVLRGTPFLKDIPLLGALFSSRDFEESGTELIFILTPSISSGGMEYADMLDMVDRKQESPKLDTGITRALTDPFGEKAYTEHMKQRADTATMERAQLESETRKAIFEAEKAKAWAEREKIRSEKFQAETAKAKAETAKAKAEAEKVKAEAEKAKSEAVRAKAEAEKAQAEAEKAKLEADSRADSPAEPNE